MSLGENIRKYRKEAGLTQAELSEKLGIIQPNIARWETNRIIPSIGTLRKLSKILNVSVDSLLFTEKEKKRFKVTERELLEKLKDLNKLTPEDRATIVNLIDTMRTRTGK